MISYQFAIWKGDAKHPLPAREDSGGAARTLTLGPACISVISKPEHVVEARPFGLINLESNLTTAMPLSLENRGHRRHLVALRS